MKTVTAENVCSGFRTAGIIPINPDAIQLPEERNSNANTCAENDPNVANSPVLT